MAYPRRGPVKAPYRRLPRKYLRAYRTQRTIRRMYPPSKFGYMAVPRTEETRARYGTSYVRATAEQRAQRAANRFYGRGSYWKKLWKNVVKPVGSAALSGALGGARGAALNLLTGHGLYTGDGMYTGQGEYSSNDLVSGGSDSIPEFSSAADETGALTVTNKEYISDVYGNDIIYTAAGVATSNTQPFVSRSLALNPGNEQAFPWLSQLAANYEEYEFKQLIFTYKSQVQDINSNNGQCGTVIMATMYNPNLPPFPDKAAMLQYAHSASSRTTDDMMHGVECDPAKLSGAPGHYVRTQPVQGDLSNYDHGSFILGVANTPSVLANGSLGELWVSYTVVLRKPKIVTGKGLTISRYLGSSQAESNTLADAVALGSIFGSSGSPSATNNFVTAVKNSLAVKTTANLTATSYPPAKIGAPIYHVSPDAPTSATLSAVPTVYLGCVIPATYSGALRVAIAVELVATLTTSTTAQFLNPPILFGNIRPLADIYASGDPATDAPSWFQSSQTRAIGTGNHRFMLIFHVKIAPASNNVDNGFYWQNGAGDGAMGTLWRSLMPTGTYSLSQATIDISEYNYGLTTSDSIDSIQFVKSNGEAVTL